MYYYQCVPHCCNGFKNKNFFNRCNQVLLKLSITKIRYSVFRLKHQILLALKLIVIQYDYHRTKLFAYCHTDCKDIYGCIHFNVLLVKIWNFKVFSLITFKTCNSWNAWCSDIKWWNYVCLVLNFPLLCMGFDEYFTQQLIG